MSDRSVTHVKKIKRGKKKKWLCQELWGFVDWKQFVQGLFWPHHFLISVPIRSGRGPTGKVHFSCTDIVHRGNKRIFNIGVISFGSQLFEGEKNKFLLGSDISSSIPAAWLRKITKSVPRNTFQSDKISTQSTKSNERLCWLEYSRKTRTFLRFTLLYPQPM